MNKILRHISFATLLVLVVGSSCQKEFDEIQPNGAYLSFDQVRANFSVSTASSSASIQGLYAMLTARELVYSKYHSDFGYPGYCLALEHAGDNVVATTRGYNWFSSHLKLEDFNSHKSFPSNVWWTFSHKNIKIANELIGFATSETKHIMGQAKAMRAWNNFNLVRLFAKNYLGNENSPGIPIIRETTPLEELTNNPRVSVEENYKFILEDLNEAVEALKGFKPTSKVAISEAVAYGIRARVHLTMGRYSEAAKDAEMAINISGARPYSIDDCSIPNFDDVQAAHNALWGIIITDEDGVTKSRIANFTSMFTSLAIGELAYTTGAGEFKRINSRLYDRIPETDIRKEWFVHTRLGKGFTSKLLTNAYTPDIIGELMNTGMPKYAVVKFAPTNKNPLHKTNSVDYMLMRVEELYYILAEAKAMAGDLAGGKKVLEDFERTNRNPSFSSQATTGKELQDEIYTIKRYEFFGEGISWFDMLRLNKGLDRIDVASKDDGGYPPLTRFNVPAGDPIFTLMFPEAEVQNNKKIENNPLGISPKDQI